MATTLEYDLDEGQEMAQPSSGWHEAVCTAFSIDANKAGTGTNMIFSLELAENDPDRPGMPWTYYVPLPNSDLIENFKEWKKAGEPKGSKWDATYLTKDGRHRYQAAMNRIKKVSAAFGGAESGAFKPEAMGRNVGKKVKINLVPEKDEGGQPTGRMQIGFDGVAPA